jgi:phosphatidylserine/phosphatidylglycerophosphate/cardiolipin synthase-like enzyme
MILGQSAVIAGSFNFTESAEKRNTENVVIMFSEDLAKQ